MSRSAPRLRWTMSSRRPSRWRHGSSRRASRRSESSIEQVQIHEGAVHWIRQLEALDELTHRVLEKREDVSGLLELVARRLRELIRARGVLISVPAPSGGLRVAAADGESVADLVGIDLEPDAKHARVLTRGRSERVDSVLEDPEVDQVVASRVG